MRSLTRRAERWEVPKSKDDNQLSLFDEPAPMVKGAGYRHEQGTYRCEHTFAELGGLQCLYKTDTKIGAKWVCYACEHLETSKPPVPVS